MKIIETTPTRDRTFQMTVTQQELVLLHSLFSYISPDTAGLDSHKVWADIAYALGGSSYPDGHITFNTITRKL